MYIPCNREINCRRFKFCSCPKVIARNKIFPMAVFANESDENKISRIFCNKNIFVSHNCAFWHEGAVQAVLILFRVIFKIDM
jgi:hypothetical protein